MTSTITPGTLTVTLTEAVSLQDDDTKEHGVTVSNVFTVASIAGFVKRLVTIPTTEVGLLAVAADLATGPAATAKNTYVAGHFDEDLVRYLRITNKDDVNFVTLVFRGATTPEFAIVLDAKRSFTFGVDNANGTKATIDASATALTVSLKDLEDITALADTASVDLEVFVVSV